MGCLLLQNLHILFFFFYRRFLSRPVTNHMTAGEGGSISVAPHHYFHPLHRHLDISGAITTENSPLHTESSWTEPRDLWFPSANSKPLSYTHNFFHCVLGNYCQGIHSITSSYIVFTFVFHGLTQKYLTFSSQTGHFALYLFLLSPTCFTVLMVSLYIDQKLFFQEDH